MTILVCDDNPLHGKEIARQALQALPTGVYAAITTCVSGAQALESIQKDVEAQWIVLLDIIFPANEDGIQIAQEINRIAPHALIIFITGDITKCTKAGRAEYIYFLTKPIDEQDLQYALDKAVKKFSTGRLFFEQKGAGFTIRASDILYVERVGRRSYIHTRKKVYDVAEKLNAIFEQTDHYSFVFSHKSYLVNLEHVTAITPRDFVMVNQELVPISHPRYPEIKQRYMEYIRRKL